MSCHICGHLCPDEESMCCHLASIHSDIVPDLYRCKSGACKYATTNTVYLRNHLDTCQVLQADILLSKGKGNTQTLVCWLSMDSCRHFLQDTTLCSACSRLIFTLINILIHKCIQGILFLFTLYIDHPLWQKFCADISVFCACT